MLIAERCEEMFNLFARIIPIKATKAQEKVIEKSFGMTLTDFILTVLVNLGHDCGKPENQESAEGYFDWISQAILYMKGETDDLPEMVIEYSAGDEATSKIQ